jgi:hypothetical protein
MFGWHRVNVHAAVGDAAHGGQTQVDRRGREPASRRLVGDLQGFRDLLGVLANLDEEGRDTSGEVVRIGCGGLVVGEILLRVSS